MNPQTIIEQVKSHTPLTVCWYESIGLQSSIDTALLHNSIDMKTDKLVSAGNWEKQQILDEICNQKRSMCTKNRKSDQQIWTTAQHGRLLAYFPEFSLSDPAAMLISQNYFDGYECPPLGTLLCLVEVVGDNAHFIAWVPPMFVELANAAITSCPDYSIRWLSSMTEEFEYVSELQATTRIL